MKESFIGLILAIGSALGIYTPEPPPPVDNLGLAVLTVPQGGTGASSFTTGECLKGNGTGAVTTGSCGGGGGTGAATSSFAATPPITLTTSASAITYGFSGLATSSQPASSNVLVSNGGAGVYGAATSSLTINSPLTTSGTAGALVGGTNLTIDIDDIKAADLDLTDITLNDFTNDANFINLTSLSGTFPIAYNSGTGAITFGGLSTSTAAVQGNLPYFSGVNTFANVATTSVTCSGNTTCTAFTAIGGAPITISSTGGGTGLSTTSPTANDQVLVYNSAGAGAAYSIATTSLSISGPFTIANPIGVLKNGAVTYTGLATTTAITQGDLFYSSGGAGVTSVATSSATCSGGTSCSAFTVVGSVAPTISSFSYPFPSNATTTALTFSATTTHTAAQIGSTAIGSNVLKVSPLTGLTVSNSESVGGIINYNLGTTDSIGLVGYTNSTGSNRLLSLVADAATYTGNPLHVRNDGTGTAVNIICTQPQGKGCIKTAVQMGSDADASALSIQIDDDDAQMIFGLAGPGWTGKFLNFRTSTSTEVLTFNGAGRFGLHASSPTATFQVGNTFFVATTTASTTIMGTFQFPTQAAASGNNCLQIDTAGAITKTGSACGAGGSGLSTSSPVSAGNVLIYSSTGAGSAFGAATSSLSVSGPFNVPSGASIIGSSGAITYYGLATSTALTGGRLLYSDGTKNVTDVATTTLAFSGPFTGASSLGSLVGGSNSTVTYTGLATTSQPASSNLLVSNGGAGVYGVATTSATCSGNTTCDAFTVIGASPITISSTGGGSGLSTTSPVSAGNLLVYSSTGAGAAFGVATSSLSISGPFVVPSSSIIGASGAITYTGLATTSQPSSSNVLTSNGGSGVYGTATTSLAFSGFPANLSGTLGALLGGANSTLTYWGLATTSALTQGQLLYNTTGGNGVASVATTTLVAGTNITFDSGTPVILGSSPITINATGGGADFTYNQSYAGQTVSATSTGIWLTGSPLSLIASSTFATNATTTNATTTNFNISGQLDIDQMTSALLLTGSTGIVAEYGGSTCTNQVTKDLTALGASNCVSINNDYWNGTALSVGNGGTGQTSFGQGWLHSDGTTITSSTSPTMNYFFATSTTATSSIRNALRIDSGTGDNALSIAAGRVYPASNSVGGMLLLSNGTTNTGPALVAYTNVTTSAGNLANFRCDNSSMAHDCVKIDHDGTGDGLAIAATAAASNALSLSNTGVDHTLNVSYTGATANKGALNLTSTNTTGSVFQITGDVDALGVGKITHTGNGDADSSILSLSASDATYAGQGLFLDMASSTLTQKVLNIRADGNEVLTTSAAGTTTVLALVASNSLRLPASASPVLAVAGECAFDTTSGQLKCSDGTNTLVIGNGKFYPSFTYATSTAWTGTTTVPLGTAFIGETWNAVQCFTDTGTVNVSFYDGTNRMNMFNGSTTVGTVTLSTNNTFTAAEKRYVDVGTPASSPTKISCTVSKSYTAD